MAHKHPMNMHKRMAMGSSPAGAAKEANHLKAGGAVKGEKEHHVRVMHSEKGEKHHVHIHHHYCDGGAVKGKMKD